MNVFLKKNTFCAHFFIVFPYLCNEYTNFETNNMNRLRLALMALTMMSASFSMADDYAFLTVSQTEGDTHFEVSHIEKITFDKKDMIVSLTGGHEQRLALEGLSKMFFNDGTLGVTAPTATPSRIRLENGVLKVDVVPGEQVTLYNIKGEVVLHATHSIAYNVSRLPEGVYIVRAGNETKKVKK